MCQMRTTGKSQCTMQSLPLMKIELDGTMVEVQVSTLDIMVLCRMVGLKKPQLILINLLENLEPLFFGFFFPKIKWHIEYYNINLYILYIYTSILERAPNPRNHPSQLELRLGLTSMKKSNGTPNNKSSQTKNNEIMTPFIMLVNYVTV